MCVRFNVPHGYVLFSPGALEAMGVGFGDRVEVLIGEAEDEGRIGFRREREGHGYTLSAQRKIELFALLRDLGLKGLALESAGEVRDGMVVVELSRGGAVAGGDD